MPSQHATIDHYLARAHLLRPAIQGLTPAQLDAHPVPNTWSIREIVVHLLESDLAATHRMRRIAGEDSPPLIIAYDETALAKHLAYERADLDLVVRLFEALRQFTGDWLRTLPDDAFARWGVHNQRGKVTLAEMIAMYIEHVDHHLKFLAQKRAMVMGVSK